MSSEPRTPAVASRLPRVGTTIFTVMSALAQQHGAVNLGQGFPDFDCDPRLVDEHRAEMRVLREVREDALDHQRLVDALRAARAGEEDLRHAAHPEAPRDDVSTEALGVGRRHARSVEATPPEGRAESADCVR